MTERFMTERLKYEDLTSADKQNALDEARELMNKEINIETMISDYKRKGERVDEVLYQVVMRVVEQSEKVNELLEKLYFGMGENAARDMVLWLEIAAHKAELTDL